ncbi:hypothetical protein AGMMS49938_12460 [Fibrobacterales bacterium]|nr:hypothetical protein AGMMS49938_12460 [Fibrobacterales bacterium]
MLAVVDQPRIRVEGAVIPEHLLLYLKAAFSRVDVSVDFESKATETESVPFRKTAWYKGIRKNMKPGENLKLLRRNRKLTQRLLSKKSGIAVSEISDMETGRISISKKTAEKLSSTLGTSTENLFW